jgi:hypothetical protein
MVFIADCRQRGKGWGKAYGKSGIQEVFPLDFCLLADLDKYILESLLDIPILNSNL